ncbi:HNH endonuclease [Halosquirtibacter laminarini]|uniref:HNH endonuclease n=1 Tax=Halosquirtibacter laminarini TaxID=3374600 RepID=A0AC61NIJ5_9BACT|nr:HNH endonuclease [Prolixibacteraceae bacterium]
MRKKNIRLFSKAREKEQVRERSNPFYHTYRWRKVSKEFLSREENQFCVHCKMNHVLAPATTTDHIIPMEICDDPYDERNFQPLCMRCNRIKGASDKRMIQQHKKKRHE